MSETTITATFNGKPAPGLTSIINKAMTGGTVTDLEQNEALTRKLDKLKDKLTDKGQKDFIKEIEDLHNNGLEEKVLGFVKEMERIEDERSNHKELQAAKSSASILNKGFTDTKKFAQMKMQFVLAVMKSRGLK